ncbi:hypothetical protein H2200_010556 [Cladophialophora chaetospira]|uniref:Major facilitator superfamily (MFS) profile domain-containing protein n=1 Tax=Cladophialophora chaetospira TaxID=386627 RepID=A0AA39CEC3_9EURO|nr:hypothetical protein H2200_010556 [Cladophialophora chaetospira]
MSIPYHDTSKIAIQPAQLSEALEKPDAIEQDVIPVPPPPLKDGGLRAWLQVVGCFLVFFNVCHSPSEISWIGTLASYLLIVIGIISGPLFDLGYYRVMLFGGAAMACLGIFMLSLSTAYYQILLTQGICTGLGCGVLFIPGMALVSRSFKARRAVALGLISCGAPFGGYPSLEQAEKNN